VHAVTFRLFSLVARAVCVLLLCHTLLADLVRKRVFHPASTVQGGIQGSLILKAIGARSLKWRGVN
jgi:hypothetical protein